MTKEEKQKKVHEEIDKAMPYELRYWQGFNYQKLGELAPVIRRTGRGDNDSYNDVIIMADTETSKSGMNTIIRNSDGTKYEPVYNYIVAWTISIRFYNRNIVTLYGQKPSHMIKCMTLLHKWMKGQHTIIYFHNASYDLHFLQRFMFKAWGYPTKQLNTKPHYPLFMHFENGLIFKDSLIVAQRSLDKWAKDLDVEHKKAVGKWDYDAIRHQDTPLTQDELEYIEHDTLAGVECIQKTMDTLGKNIVSMPYTATGIPREQCQKRGKAYNAREQFTKVALSFELQCIMDFVYHGGYTHGNRHYLNQTITGKIEAEDLSSSYPFALLGEMYPGEQFTKINDCTLQQILEYSDEYAFIFKLVMIKPRLKDYDWPMPSLSKSKAVKIINPIEDNGRILGADYISIYLDSVTASVVAEQYTCDNHICTEVYKSKLKYLPRWLTDYIYDCYAQKTYLKGGDPVQYSIAKATVNSIYGMHVQKPIKELINEDYDTGEYIREEWTEEQAEEEYNKYLKKRTSILPFQYGVFCTAYAFRNLFNLGKCCKTWLYSDTDSVYGIDWDKEKLQEYNNTAKNKLIKNGYGPVLHNNREYWLGIAEPDAVYTEYRYQGAKRYCGRSDDDGELHITVAGVPKRGATCLKDDITNFQPGFVFDGVTTGKKMYYYMPEKKIKVNSAGDEYADSIDLVPCDYKLDGVEKVMDWQELLTEEVYIPLYE